MAKKVKKKRKTVVDKASGWGGGKKRDQDKPRTDLISAIATIKKAWVYTHGARIYKENNWRKGLKWSRVLAALERHLLWYKTGQTLDPETKMSHMAAVACCADFLLEFEETHPKLDDRYKISLARLWQGK